MRTKLFLGESTGATLRRLLPRVKSMLIRGYGPEVPDVPRTSLREDGWLSLELHAGPYAKLSSPAPTITLAENAGIQDGFWPTDAPCADPAGTAVLRPELGKTKAARTGQRKVAAAMPLACHWRPTIELLRDSGRLVFVTSYNSHEHLKTLRNLRSIGCKIRHAYPFGFRQVGSEFTPLVDLLRPEATERSGNLMKESFILFHAQYAHDVEVLGWERHVRFVRNSHVIAFQGKRGSRSPDLGQTSQQIELEVNRQACEAAVLKSFPEKKAELVRSVISCDAYEAARAYGVLRG